MAQENRRHGEQDYIAIHSFVRPLEQSKVTNEKGDFEEAYSHLVDGSAGKVDSSVGDLVLRRP